MNKKSNSAKPELLKKINQEQILRQIVKSGEISRAELSRVTGLALPSVMRLVEPLIEKGVIKEVREGESTGGRKPNLLALNANYKWIIGVEITSKIIITLADFSGKVTEAFSFGTDYEDTPETVLYKIIKEIQNLLIRHDISPSRVAAIGVGTPGSDFKHKEVKKGFISKGWEVIDVKLIIEDALEIQTIVENVCRTRTLSEIWFGHGRFESDFLYAFIDWGVGIGIVKQGTLETGFNNVAGEFGHTSIDRNGRPCYCGKKGCIEMYASVGALVFEPNQFNPLIEVERSKQFSESEYFEWLVSLKERPEIQSKVAELSNELAFALANVINLMNPKMVVLGGVLPRLIPEITDYVKENIPDYIFHNLALSTPILLSEVNNENQCLGSIALVIQNELIERD